MANAADEPRAEARLMSLRAGNKVLGICRTTSMKWASRPDSTLPRPFKRGSRWVYLEDEVSTWAVRQAALAHRAAA